MFKNNEYGFYLDKIPVISRILSVTYIIKQYNHMYNINKVVINKENVAYGWENSYSCQLNFSFN